MKRHSVIIGTSPSMLIHALALVEAGDDVTIVDRANAPGGAWITPPLVELDSVESGVHLLENRPRFYDMLRRLGIELKRDTLCEARWRRRRLDMAPARVLFHSMVAVNALRRGQIDQFRRIAFSAARGAIHLKTPFQYPPTGCRALHEHLTQALACHGVTPFMNTEITLIEVDSDAGVFCSTPETGISADRVLIGSRAHAPLIINQRKIIPLFEDNNIVTLVLRGEDVQRNLVSYVELMGDPLLKRLRDVSLFCLPRLDAHEFVFSVQLRASGEKLLASSGPKAVVDYLVKLKLLSEAVRLSHSAICNYPYQTITDSGLRTIERRARGRVLGVRTTDFADGFRSSWRDHY